MLHIFLQYSTKFLTHIVEKYAIIPDIDLFLTWEHTLCLKLHYKVTTVGPESTTKEIDFCIFRIPRLPSITNLRHITCEIYSH